MRTIYKYELKVVDEQEIKMPKWGKILTVQMQRGVPCIWVEVLTEHKSINRRIFIFGTGHDMTQGERYIGSFQVDDTLVFHVYE